MPLTNIKKCGFPCNRATLLAVLISVSVGFNLGLFTTARFKIESCRLWLDILESFTESRMGLVLTLNKVRGL